MRFRDFVYEFQRTTKSKVEHGSEQEGYLSDIYSEVTGLPEDRQRRVIERYAQFFILGETKILSLLEKKLADQAKSKRSV